MLIRERGDYNWDNAEWTRAYFKCPVIRQELRCPDGCRAITPEVVECQGASIMLVHSHDNPTAIIVLMRTMQYRYTFDYPPEVGETILESVQIIVKYVKKLCLEWASEDAVKYRLAGGLWN